MTLIEWTHPSVRDLVIDHLMTYEPARFDFLQKASVGGVVLALSTAGGSEGSRDLPLVRTDNDWQGLGARIAELIADASPSEQETLLAAFEAPIRHSEGQPYRASLVGLLAGTLAVLRGIWNASPTKIRAEALRLYTSLSEVTRPLEPLPDLFPTWSAAVERAGLAVALEAEQDDEEENEFEDPSALLALSNWLALARLIARNEPRLLRSVKITTKYESVVRKALKPARGWLQELHVPMQDYDSTSGEPAGLSDDEEELLGLLDELDGPLRHVAFLFSDLADEARELSQLRATAEDNLRSLESEREEWLENRARDMLDEFDPFGSDDADDDDDGSDVFDIAQVFSDL